MISDAEVIPVSVSTLLPTTNVGVDLYCRVANDQNYALFCDKDLALKIGQLEQLKTRGVQRLYFLKRQQERYQAYLRDLLDDSRKGDVPISAQAGALGQVVRELLESSFATGNAGHCVAIASKLGEETAELVTNDAFAADDLCRVLKHDYATFTHSANVAMFAGLLGNKLGFDKTEIAQITAGGLIHDLGKLEIDDRILCKPGRLNEQEFARIREHPTIGFRKVAERSDLNFGQLMMVYQHHERIDGTGYPVGHDGPSIHPWAKLCAVVDVFEALTSNRPYRKPMAKSTAVEIMKKDVGAFDAEMLQCWVEITETFWTKSSAA